MAALSTADRHEPIRAAGGVVWRPGGSEPVVALVHRPRYDDWSLPKGKIKRGEHAIAAAVREVEEETGVRAVPRFPLPRVRYWLGQQPKQVDYWSMVPAPDGIGGFAPNSEVDGLAWLPVSEAVARLSYAHDAQLLRHWAGLPLVTGLVLLVRHAEAGERWRDGDTQRPLSSAGVHEATEIGRLLALFGPDRLISASPVRCRQTLEPLAAALQLAIEVDPVFDETTSDPAAGGDRLRALAATGATTVICSQRTIIPVMLARITGGTGPTTAAQWRTAKGDGWVLPFAGTDPLLSPVPVHTKRVRQ